MKHEWIKREFDQRRLCVKCGLYSWYDVRTSPCRGRYAGDNNRQEPSEDVLRALGHFLK